MGLLGQQARPLCCGSPAQGHATSWSQQGEHQPLVHLAGAGGFSHNPGWVPCPDLASLCCCCCCSGGTSQGFVMTQHNNGVHHLGDKCPSARSDTRAACPLLSLSLPHRVQQMPLQQLGAFFRGLLGHSPCAARCV